MELTILFLKFNFNIMSIIKMNFNTDIAKIVGTDSAIIYSNIEYWVEHNRLNEKHFYDGNYWTYNSIEAFKKYFDYLTISQIKTCINKLEKHNLIEIGNYNKLGYDRTKWYSIPLNSTNGEFSQMDLSNMENGLAKNDQPIPYYKPDIKKEEKNGTSEDVCKVAEESVQKLTDAYIKKIDEIFVAKEAEIMKV